jgi:hypothetical protein
VSNLYPKRETERDSGDSGQREQTCGWRERDKLAFINPQFWLKDRQPRVHYYTSCKYIATPLYNIN